MQQPDKSPFQLLIDDLAALQQSQIIENEFRNRHSRRAQISRLTKANRAAATAKRTAAKPAQQRPLAKAAPPAPVLHKTDFDRIAADQDRLQKALQDTGQRQIQQQVRNRIADLRAQARAGHLDAMSGARLDVLIGQAAKMGLTP